MWKLIYVFPLQCSYESEKLPRKRGVKPVDNANMKVKSEISHESIVSIRLINKWYFHLHVMYVGNSGVVELLRTLLILRFLSPNLAFDLWQYIYNLGIRF